jgi:hypoxanthine phosphoribosyltransferase
MQQEIEKILEDEKYDVDILLSESEIKHRIKELGQQITEDYQDKDVVLVGALTGSFIFMADICREIELNCEIAFLKISSYGYRTTTSGKVTLQNDIKTDIHGKDVIIVEDIVDTGISLSFLTNHLSKFRPNSIKIVALLNKPEAHHKELTIDYIGFDIKNEFVIGYGLDFANKKRNLKNIYTVKFNENGNE